jgi:hypothetical protein
MQLKDYKKFKKSRNQQRILISAFLFVKTEGLVDLFSEISIKFSEKRLIYLWMKIYKLQANESCIISIT